MTAEELSAAFDARLSDLISTSVRQGSAQERALTVALLADIRRGYGPQQTVRAWDLIAEVLTRLAGIQPSSGG
jgi:hypothetical protein